MPQRNQTSFFYFWKPFSRHLMPWKERGMWRMKSMIVRLFATGTYMRQRRPGRSDQAEHVRSQQERPTPARISSGQEVSAHAGEALLALICSHETNTRPFDVRLQSHPRKDSRFSWLIICLLPPPISHLLECSIKADLLITIPSTQGTLPCSDVLSA